MRKDVSVVSSDQSYLLDVCGGKDAGLTSDLSLPPILVDLLNEVDDVTRLKGQLVVTVCCVVIDGLILTTF